MTDITLFKQYELAWSEFIEWYYGKDDFYYLDIEQDLPLLIILAIIQQYLDEKGIPTWSEWNYILGCWQPYASLVKEEPVILDLFWDKKDKSDFSACIKGFGIRNNQLKDK